MKLTLHVWRQPNADAPGAMKTYQANDIGEDMSFLEMLDVVNEGLIAKRRGSRSPSTTTAAKAFAACVDWLSTALRTDLSAPPPHASCTCAISRTARRSGSSRGVPARSPCSRILLSTAAPSTASSRPAATSSVNTGAAPEAHSVPVAKDERRRRVRIAACIGCGACVAACPNASAMLFTAAKITHLGLLPQGQPERNSRVIAMVDAMEQEGFGSCTNIGECSAACPKEIPLDTIARMNSDLLAASVRRALEPSVSTEK